MTFQQLFNRWVILGAIIFAGLLILITSVSIGLTTPREDSSIGFVPADLTVIPASTSTSSAPPTPTIDPFAPSPTPTGLAVGNYAQITGTEGQGLRIRATPGLDGEFVFLGYDSEVFVIQDGPQTVDGYVWWYLVAPYDTTRVGWAAADFLTFIPAP
jgi:hypothetical protein